MVDLGEGVGRPAPYSRVHLVPSALEWLGVDSDTTAFSGQVLPLPGEPGSAERAERTVYASGIAYGPEKIAARSGRLKTIFAPASDHFTYYDLAADPREQRPLPAHAEVTMLFDTLVGDYLERESDAAVASSSFSDQQIRELKAIGYLQGVEADDDAGEDSSPGSGDHAQASEEDSP